MDKQTLSNYGWIVVCILVLSVMLALATPLGEFIAGGFKAAYVGFDMTANKALGVIGLGNSGSGGGDETPDTPTVDLSEHENHYIIYQDNGDGATHLIHCKDCDVVLADKEAHYDNDSNNSCDACGFYVGNCEHTNLTAYDGAPYGDTEYHYLQCNDCGSWLEDEKHNYVDGVCDVCGNVFTCSHNSTTFVDSGDGVTHNKICNDCSETIATGLDHYGYDEDGICNGCGASVEVTACDHFNTVYYDLENGKHEMWCEDCGQYLGTESHEDADGDRICEGCGAVVSATACEHLNTSYSNSIHNHSLVCDDCGSVIDGTAEDHYDNDNDGFCDACNGALCDNCNQSNLFGTDNGDGTHDYECGECGNIVEGEAHKDHNGDTECEICLGTVEP